MKSVQQVPFFFLLLLFIAELLFSRILQGEHNTRLTLMIVPLFRVGILSCLLFVFLIPFINLPPKWGKKFIIPVPSNDFFLAALCFELIAILACVEGFFSGHKMVYIVGDLYKFMIFPSMALVIYWGVRAIDDFDRLLFYILYLYTVFLIGTLILYFFDILALQKRAVAIYIFPFIPIILLHLRTFFKYKIVFCLLFFFYLISFPILIWFTQSLGLLFQVVCLFLMTFFFYSFPGKFLRSAYYLIGGGVAAGLFLLGAFSLGMADIFDSEWQSDFYLTRKLSFLREYGLSLVSLELIGGKRVAQLVTVLSYFYDHPVRIFLGQGLGGELITFSVTGLENRVWEGAKHFIEGGYPEVLYRMGIAGLITYIYIFIILFRRALSCAKNNIFCSLAAAYAFFMLIFSSCYTGYIGDGFGSLFIFGILLAGVSVYKKNQSQNIYRYIPEG